MSAIINGTDGITFPTWTTGTRPASPAVGQAGYNTTIGAMETYTGSTWSTSDLPAPSTSGNFLQSTGTAWTSATTLGVANGGTGATTLTANNVLLGNGTSALQVVAPGSSGNVLTSNGTTWTSAAAGGGSLQSQLFTAPGTWTKPSSTTQVRVTVIGGGGGGSAPNNVTAGTPGGTSSFGAAVSATGGTGASRSPGGATIGGSPGTGTVTTGTALKTIGYPQGSFPVASGYSINGITGIYHSGTATSTLPYSVTGVSMAGDFGDSLPGSAPLGGGVGGIAAAITPVSAPVSVTVGTGGTGAVNPGSGVPTGFGCGGAVMVEFVG